MKNVLLSTAMVFVFMGCSENGALSGSNEVVTIENVMYQNQPFDSKAKFTENEKFGPNFLDTFMKKSRRVKWSQAKEYCEELELGGYSDWRLPTHQELEKVLSVDVYYALGDYKNFDEYAKEHLENAKKHVDKIKPYRVESGIGSELVVKKEFLENMPLINDKNPMGEFWAADERDEFWAMTLDLRNAVAWWTRKERGIGAYVLCCRKK